MGGCPLGRGVGAAPSRRRANQDREEIEPTGSACRGTPPESLRVPSRLHRLGIAEDPRAGPEVTRVLDELPALHERRQVPR